MEVWAMGVVLFLIASCYESLDPECVHAAWGKYYPDVFTSLPSSLPGSRKCAPPWLRELKMRVRSWVPHGNGCAVCDGLDRAGGFQMRVRSWVPHGNGCAVCDGLDRAGGFQTRARVQDWFRTLVRTLMCSRMRAHLVIVIKEQARGAPGANYHNAPNIFITFRFIIIVIKEF